MEPVDYGDTSEEDPTEQATKSSTSSSTRKLKREQESNSKPSTKRKPMTQSDIINNNLDNLASLIPILQSHQQLIDAESTSMSQLSQIHPPKKHKHSYAHSSHSHASAIKKSNKKSMQIDNIMP
eukprot:UN00295